MKRKAVMSVPPKLPVHKKSKLFTVQRVGEILVLNYWKNGNLASRYCMNVNTHEFETWIDGKWTQQTLQSAVEKEWYVWPGSILKEIQFDTPEDKQKALLPKVREWRSENDVMGNIIDWQDIYRGEKRQKQEMRRKQRIKDLMALVPDDPEGLGEWIDKTVFGAQEYALYNRENRHWTCSACGGTFPDKPKITHKTHITCPVCRAALEAKKLGNPEIRKDKEVMVIQAMDNERTAIKYIDVRMVWNLYGRKLQKSEAVRIILSAASGEKKSRYFMGQIPKNDHLWTDRSQEFDDRHGGGANRNIGLCFLYPQGIEEASAATICEEKKRLLRQLAEAGVELNYNNTINAGQKEWRIIEYLFKGGFSRLLKETVGCISRYSGNYYGPLRENGRTIQEVFGLGDRQKINRIRDCDGGDTVLRWMRWSERTGQKINDETLRWAAKENVGEENINFINDRMSLTQVMNYVRKQQAGGYKKKSARAVLNQWHDYLDMCKREGKNTSDELVYRPRELKRRHDEIVEEIRKREIIERMRRDKRANKEYAKKMREKFPGAEENLKAVREKFEYQDEEYRIIVPRTLAEIAAEGSALHHCAGASERYYERIMQKETYICFLRRANEPGIPFYTIEVEPGGAIRQHRSYYDEEPGIAEIRGFLRKWQREIKKRLTQEDHRLAKESARKRADNIEKLKAKQNTRVLKALMEDFMEAM